jgi:acyl-CoA thioesterase I
VRTTRTRSLVAGIALAVGAAAGVVLARDVARALAAWRRPPGHPVAFVRAGRRPGARAILVCAGDSLTHGIAGADYVGPLRTRLAGEGYAVVNAGINGNLAWNVLQRLDEVIACRPDAVTVLIGSNDVLGTLGPTWESMYRAQQRIPETPTLDWYRQNLCAILDRLGAETRARVAVLDLPPIGEDLGSATNDLVRRYNAVIREVAAERAIGVLPLHERLVAQLPEDHAPAPFDGTRRLMGAALVRRALLRQTWSQVSTANGLEVLTDGIHLNDRGAAVVADLIEAWLTAPA